LHWLFLLVMAENEASAILAAVLPAMVLADAGAIAILALALLALVRAEAGPLSAIFSLPLRHLDGLRVVLGRCTFPLAALAALSLGHARPRAPRFSPLL
jgi:hypothetical protein